MAIPKYKITDAILDTTGAIHKLERDGHNRESIHKAMYALTQGASSTERTAIMRKLYMRYEKQGGNYGSTDR
jgi:hypothetical protein